MRASVLTFLALLVVASAAAQPAAPPATAPAGEQKSGADPELIWNVESDRFTATLGIEYGKAIGRAELLILKPTVGLTDGTTDWGIKFAFRHMFPGRFIF